MMLDDEEGQKHMDSMFQVGSDVSIDGLKFVEPGETIEATDSKMKWIHESIEGLDLNSSLDTKKFITRDGRAVSPRHLAVIKDQMRKLLETVPYKEVRQHISASLYKTIEPQKEPVKKIKNTTVLSRVRYSENLDKPSQ